MDRNKKPRMRKENGFTLIELIMVIVVLAVLAVTAVPKYYSLKTDAAASSAHGITSALRGSISILYAKNLVGGTDGAAYDITSVVTNAQIEGIDSSSCAAGAYTATIGGIPYEWTYTAANLPDVAGSISDASGDGA